MRKIILIISLAGITIFATMFSGCSSNQEQSSTDSTKAETTTVVSTTIQETTQEQTTETPTTKPAKPDDWLTINSVEKQTDGFGWISECTYTGSNYSLGENEMEGPVLYGAVELSVDEKEISGFGSSLILPDGSHYTGYDFQTTYSGKKFAVSLPKALPSGDYLFELQLFRGYDEEVKEENSSVSTVKFTINQ